MTKFLLAVAVFLAGASHPARADDDGLKDAVILLIRHAEKSETSDGLIPAGEARAQAYTAYFQNYQIGGAPLKIDAIFAAADSASSRRPRLTVEPAAKALGLTVDATYKNKNYQAMVDDLKTRAGGRHVLICWHHGEMPDLLRALGANPGAMLPGGRWPDGEYNWLIELRYDGSGHLQQARRVSERLTGSR